MVHMKQTWYKGNNMFPSKIDDWKNSIDYLIQLVKVHGITFSNSIQNVEFLSANILKHSLN